MTNITYLRWKFNFTYLVIFYNLSTTGAGNFLKKSFFEYSGRDRKKTFQSWGLYNCHLTRRMRMRILTFWNGWEWEVRAIDITTYQERCFLVSFLGLLSFVMLNIVIPKTPLRKVGEYSSWNVMKTIKWWRIKQQWYISNIISRY